MGFVHTVRAQERVIPYYSTICQLGGEKKSPAQNVQGLLKRNCYTVLTLLRRQCPTRLVEAGSCTLTPIAKALCNLSIAFEVLLDRYGGQDHQRHVKRPQSVFIRNV